VVGAGRGFEVFRLEKYSRQGQGLKKSMRLAMQEAAVGAEDIDYISCAANSRQDADSIEADAIKEVLGKNYSRIPASAVKSMVGESFGAGSALQFASALAAIERQAVPPTVNYREKDPQCDLDCVANQARTAKIEKVLINAFGPSGSSTSLVIADYKGY
jgi:3-oxoacyl-[acyl-carrier-protein] synthase II